jgi:hypothetical protein
MNLVSVAFLGCYSFFVSTPNFVEIDLRKIKNLMEHSVDVRVEESISY